MTDDSHVPDSVNELLRRIQRSQCGPIASTLPAFDFGHEDAGMLDALIVLEQIILVSGGANLIQMLHAASWIVEACQRGMDESIDSLKHDQDSQADDVKRQLLADAARLEACGSLLRELVQGPTYVLGAQKAAAMLARGMGQEHALRVLVSKKVLVDLGLDHKEFDRAFIERHNPE